MAFTFAAFCYMLTLVLCASLIFFVIWHIIAFDELRTDFKNPIDQGNPARARERLKNIERICCLLRKLVVPEYSIHGLFCLMFLCAAEWVTLGLNIPLLFYHLWRYFHRPADGSEVMYDAVSIMNADILNYCQKESWCKLAFYLLSFFYYLYSLQRGMAVVLEGTGLLVLSISGELGPCRQADLDLGNSGQPPMALTLKLPLQVGGHLHQE
ncbi:hypothetical protein ACRRTK_011340 [Alexandromys fortis]